MRVMMGPVIGSLTQGVADRESLARLIPARTLLSVGRDERSRIVRPLG